MSEKCKQRFGYICRGYTWQSLYPWGEDSNHFLFIFSFYSLPQPVMSNADLNRIINSEEIQAVLRPAG